MITLRCRDRQTDRDIEQIDLLIMLIFDMMAEELQ